MPLVCRLISQRVWVIFGPHSNQATSMIQSITSYYKIPLVLTSWQPHFQPNKTISHHNSRRSLNNFGDTSIIRRRSQQQKTSNKVPTLYNYTINLYPYADSLSRAYLDLIVSKNWKSFSLIYDTAENFIRLKDVLQASYSGASISIHKLDETKLDSDIKPQLTLIADSDSSTLHEHEETCHLDEDRNIEYGKLMKDLRLKGTENIILSLPLDKVCKIIREAKYEQLFTVYNDYIIANLDTHLLNLDQIQTSTHLQTNISGYTLLDPAGQQADYTVSKKWLGKRPLPRPKKLLSSDYAIMSDAVTIVAHSLDELISSKESSNRVALEPSFDCRSGESWEHGDALMDIMKSSARSGAYTGDIKFDQYGQRIGFDLEFIMHKNNMFQKLGVWNTTSSKLWDYSRSNEDFGLQAIKNKTLRVSIALTEPYVMYKENHTERFGNDRYRGYCIDLLNKLAKKLQFNYVLKEVSDGQYGKIQNGSWNGMIRELLDGKADLAIVDLTITKERQSAVDFTHPFMTLGIAIMFKKPKVEKAELFSFLMPFSTEVWLSMGSASIGVVLLMWLISRISPLEWVNPHPCDDEMDDQDYENELHSVGASFWFITGSLMQQGSDLAPRSASVRALSSVWYFFTLILISSYTANFAAFLTASRMQSPIESAEDLSKQTKIDYGCKEAGSTQAFFASSDNPTYRKMWNFMESRKHQGVFTPDNKKGIQLVKKGNFAFLMESTSIEYITQRDCEITQIGSLLDHKGYGIALKKRSPFRASISKAIVELNEAGELQDLKNQWWNYENQACEETINSASATSELGIDKVGGVFVLLGIGVGLACLLVITEFVWKSLKIAKDKRVSDICIHVTNLTEFLIR